MAAYDMLISLVKEYFVDLGYNGKMLDAYFSNAIFKEIISIKLANANVMIKNKTDRSSHQTHIAITGEAIDFFYDENVFRTLDNQQVDKKKVFVVDSNIQSLFGRQVNIENPNEIERIEGVVTLGKRTQKQVQLSKRNTDNSESFNALRLGLYENDLLIMLKYRNDDSLFAMGIPQTFYLDYIPNYSSKYESNTYLRLPMSPS